MGWFGDRAGCAFRHASIRECNRSFRRATGRPLLDLNRRTYDSVVDDSDRQEYWSSTLKQALGHLWPEQVAAGVRAAREAETLGASAEDALWAGKAAAANADRPLDLPETNPDPSTDWESLTVLSTVRATILKLTLETAGIPVVLETGSGWDVGLAPDGQVKVLVPHERVIDAREVIADSQPVDSPEGD